MRIGSLGLSIWVKFTLLYISRLFWDFVTNTIPYEGLIWEYELWGINYRTLNSLRKYLWRGIGDFNKSAFDLVKSENRSREESHKLDGIGVERIRTFPFLPIPFTTTSLMTPWKLRLSESEAEAEEPTNHMARNRTLWLVYSSDSACDSDYDSVASENQLKEIVRFSLDFCLIDCTYVSTWS